MKSASVFEFLFDEARIRRIATVFVAFGVLTVIALIATSSGGLDYQDRPLGTDFSNVWSAGKMVLDGRAAEAYNPYLQLPVQQAIFNDPDVPFYAWHYPPFFLMVATVLALVPYTAGWLIWMAVTLPLYLAAMRRIVPGRTAFLVTLGFPAVIVNFLHGQNAFLTAALLGGALIYLKPRPVLAGLLIGFLSYKPQFGVLIPLALMVGGHWHAFVAAGVTVVSLCVASTFAFGWEIWPAFITSGEFTRTVILEQGSTGWHKIQSLFSAVRMWGGSIPTAYVMQAALAVLLMGVVTWLWRSKAAYELKAAGLIVGCLLFTPYALDYDLVALAPAIGFLVVYLQRHGAGRLEYGVIAATWLGPIITRPFAQVTSLPFGLIAMMVLLVLILYHARARDDVAVGSTVATS